MSWNTIYVDGRKCYKSCDGEILNSTQDITALENYREEQYQLAKEKSLEQYYRAVDRQYEPEIEPMEDGQKIFVCFVMIVFAAAVITRFFY